MGWKVADLDISQCVFCTRKARTGFTCEAFPEGIPDEILENEFDHRKPHPDDNGLTFEPKDSFVPPEGADDDEEPEEPEKAEPEPEPEEEPEPESEPVDPNVEEIWRLYGEPRE